MELLGLGLTLWERDRQGAQEASVAGVGGREELEEGLGWVEEKIIKVECHRTAAQDAGYLVQSSGSTVTEAGTGGGELSQEGSGGGVMG